MGLSKKRVGSYTYYGLFMSCPVCTSRGTHTSQQNWVHHLCGGTIYVGDNAHYLCDNCNHNSHVKQWKYGCPTHSGGSDNYEFVSVNSGELAATIAVAGQMVNEAGVAWLQAFLANMGEF